VKKKEQANREADVAPELPAPAPLYRWYHKHKRDLPFRRSRDPYRVWISEVMLQQTRVQAMLPRYEAFVERFPDLESLAAAEEEEVLAAWKGLGYYSRARNLRRGAQRIVAEHGGQFPRKLSEALALPGVGPYTAAAVLSIALTEPHAVFDGNVKRVMARLRNLRPRPAESRGAYEKRLQQFADLWMERRGKTADPGDHNQAVMELGAMVCTPGRPSCEACPLRAGCAAWQSGGPELAAELPPPPNKPKMLDLELDVLLLLDPSGERVLLVREADSRFFRGLWFFPYSWRGEVRFEQRQAPGWTGLREAGDPAPDAVAIPFQHGITHHRIRGAAEVRRLRESPERFLQELPRAGEIEWSFAPLAELEERVVSSLARKILQAWRSAAGRRREAPGLFD